MKLLLNFDIGHSSIGWGVLEARQQIDQTPKILGCGTVLFPADDCLASVRRTHRRSRRNIRATRLRIARIKTLLLHLGVLSEAELNATGHPAPHFLAAKALSSDLPVLSWLEIWHILRWYAHNRGYDGNSRWARQGNDSDDTDKEKTALSLMQKFETSSMAETICAVLKIDPKGHKIASANIYKSLDAAFPRKVVRAEVLKILNLHKGHLLKLDQNLIDTLIASDEKNEHRAWESIKVPTIKMPRRYFGGLLFGQLIPRFDNRIIGRCSISGDKVPKKASRAFYNYRWAMILANLRVDNKPLSSRHRKALHSEMKAVGSMSVSEFKKALRVITASENNNVSAYFETHPDSVEALIYDPALALYKGHGTGSKNIKSYWNCLPELVRKRAMGRWKKGRCVDLNWMLSQCEYEKDLFIKLNQVIEREFKKDQKKKRPTFPTYEHLLNVSFAPNTLTGRAPYSRAVMDRVFNFVMSTNRHPSEAPTEELEPGPLYRSEAVLEGERKLSISKLTNNHLVRQRLDILMRLVDDILIKYGSGSPNSVSDIVLEVASDLQTFSGLSNKEMMGELTKRMKHFKNAVAYLEKEAPSLEINGSLIRKCRIAMDLEWKCPFTGKEYSANELPSMEREHIIPYADRPTNALDALVLTFPWVNKLKGKRTALEFIKDEDGANQLFSVCQYREFVEKKIKVANKDSYPDDYRRQSNRKKFLLVEHYDPRDLGFTPGALTQTSYLNRLAARQLEKRFFCNKKSNNKIRIHAIPGQVTAEVRRSWRLLGALAKDCPEILNKDGSMKTKAEIRSITHLHHAVDAVVIGLTHFYLPGNLPGKIFNEKGAIWAALLERNKSQDEIDLLMQTGMFAMHYKNKADISDRTLDVHLLDIPEDVKDQLSECLTERRVVQHIPADQSGSHLELNAWRVRHVEAGHAVITQANEKAIFSIEKNCRINKSKPNSEKLKLIGRSVSKCPANVFDQNELNKLKNGILKIDCERISKLVGLEEGKLKANNSVLRIAGNYGLVIAPEIVLIRSHAVSKQLETLRKKYPEKKLIILRNGDLIKLNDWGNRSGVWRVKSCKASLKIDLLRPHLVNQKSKADGCWREVRVEKLINSGKFQLLSRKFI